MAAAEDPTGPRAGADAHSRPLFDGSGFGDEDASATDAEPAEGEEATEGTEGSDESATEEATEEATPESAE